MEEKKETNNKSPNGKEMRAKFSTAWIFVTFNYLYCDVLALMDSNLLNQFISGNAGGMAITERFLLGASILMEIPIAMIILSRLLKYKTNRLANIIAGIIMSVVQFASLFFGSEPTMYYGFFSIIEITCTILIVVYAWKWKH
jgi:hypothetical protein